jgi:tetratricopeptide (TPR) repeat protein
MDCNSPHRIKALVTPRDLMAELAYEGDSEGEEEDDVDESEILSDLVDISIPVDALMKVSVDESYVSVDIRPGDALISVNGIRVLSKKHAESLIAAAKEGSTDACISLRFLRGVLERSDVHLLYEHSDIHQCSEALLQRYLTTCDFEIAHESHTKALQAAKQALFIAKSYRNSDDNLLINCYEKAGYCAKKLGDNVEAVKHFESALVLLTSMHGGHSVRLISSFEMLSGLYRRLKNYPASFTACENMLAILDRNEGADVDRRLIGNTYHSIAFVYRAHNELVKAESAAVHALELRSLHLEKTHLDIAQSLNFVASLRLERGDISSETENMYLEALNILSQGTNCTIVTGQQTTATLLRNVSWFYCNRSDYSRAEEYKRREIELRFQVSSKLSYMIFSP